MRAVVIALLLAACFSKPPRPTAQADAASDAMGDAPPVDAPGPYNIMFVSSVPYLPYQLGGVAGANAACNALAQSKLPGTYVAWISTSTSNAIDQLVGSLGWVRPDMMPFADTVGELAAGKFYYPPRIDEDGHEVAIGTQVATGTNQDGIDVVGGDCGGFTDMNAPIRSGLADSGAITWTNSSQQANCQTAMHIYCFGTGLTNALPAPNAAGPRAFVSTPMNLMAGAMAMDTACTTEANSNGIQGKFKAVIASTNETAIAHVGGTPALPWVRLDGTPVTSDFVNFTAALDLTTSGGYVSANVVTGAMMPTIFSPTGAENCADWAGSGSTTDYGHSDRAMYRAFYAGSGLSCASPQSVYCVQTGP